MEFQTTSSLALEFQIFSKIEKNTLYYMSQKKWAPTNGVPSNKFCFKECSYIHIIEMPWVSVTPDENMCLFGKIVL